MQIMTVLTQCKRGVPWSCYTTVNTVYGEDVREDAMDNSQDEFVLNMTMVFPWT